MKMLLKAEDRSFWSEVMLVGIGSPGTSSGSGRRLLSCKCQEKHIVGTPQDEMLCWTYFKKPL